MNKGTPTAVQLLDGVGDDAKEIDNDENPLCPGASQTVTQVQENEVPPDTLAELKAGEANVEEKNGVYVKVVVGPGGSGQSTEAALRVFCD